MDTLAPLYAYRYQLLVSKVRNNVHVFALDLALCEYVAAVPLSPFSLGMIHHFSSSGDVVFLASSGDTDC